MWNTKNIRHITSYDIHIIYEYYNVSVSEIIAGGPSFLPPSVQVFTALQEVGDFVSQLIGESWLYHVVSYFQWPHGS